jgi:magnesium-transporting ATPase (P-type)
MCFDKTGTLTEDGLDFYGLVPCSRKIEVTFGDIINSLKDLNENDNGA